MRNIGLLLLLASFALPAFAIRQVTVAQLEQVLDAAAAKPDIDVVKELADLQLGERLSASRLSALTAKAPGPETAATLVALANAATFLNLPAAEIPSTPSPDVAAQRQMLGLAVQYVAKTIPQLPNFFATRVTVRYNESPTELTPGTWPIKLGLHAVDVQATPIALRRRTRKRSARFDWDQAEEPPGNDLVGRVRTDSWHHNSRRSKGQTLLEPLGTWRARPRSRLPVQRHKRELALRSELLLHRARPG